MSCSPNYIAVSIQVLNFSFCVTSSSGSPVLSDAIDAIQITLGAFMCLLVALQFTREALQTYKATKSFRISCYTNLLVREGMLYFVVYVPGPFFAFPLANNDTNVE